MADRIPSPNRNPARSRQAATAGLAWLAAVAIAGCAGDRAEITPTTQGTDLSRVPAGRMVPQPFPGSSLARDAGRANGDPSILTAGGSDATIR
ncbi:hypothetical protein TA3x_002916 [Tundrisphaera sp. TA3]|uniref:hypothetical protein n=1 Tax=Tundrisphaera sp. TA3 TaxID=3435775 RepID=UPI003EB947ED